jgi:hypothetical protein
MLMCGLSLASYWRIAQTLAVHCQRYLLLRGVYRLDATPLQLFRNLRASPHWRW